VTDRHGSGAACGQGAWVRGSVVRRFT